MSLRRSSLVDGLFAFGFCLFMGLYIVLIFYKEDFAYYDNDQITGWLLQGGSFPPPIWTMAGRFFPLGFQEFNVVALITRSPAGFQSFAVAQLAILVGALFVVLNEFKLVYRALIILAVMLAPSFVISFTGLIYPERNVLFWLAILVWCLCGYSKTKARIYFVGCLVATHFALYYKETVVVFIVAYAGCRLALELKAGQAGKRWSWKELARQNSLTLGMLLVSAAFLVLWAAAMLPSRSFSYVDTVRLDPSSALLGYLHTNWLPFILLPVVVLRFCRFTLGNGHLDPIWDSLGVSALAYCCCLVALGLYAAYYAAPTDFIALPYLARVSRSWLSKPTRLRVAAVAAVFICLVVHDAAYSSFRVIERKGVITLRSQLAEFLRSYRPAGSSGQVELFFPYARGKRLMELSAYLDYKGLPLARHGGAGSGRGPGLLIESPQDFPQNRCTDYRDYACFRADGPQDGALIVVLPDDHASTRDVERAFGRDSARLLSVKACGLCTREGSWFKLLHTISPEFWKSQLPEHWLQLDVFRRGALAGVAMSSRTDE